MNIDFEVIEKMVKEYPNNMELGEALREFYHKFKQPIVVDDAGCDVATGKFLG
jgi:hypothetical protein